MPGMADDDDERDGPDEDASASVRPIRALMRGIETLQELNRHNGASVTEIAKAVGLPRTTSYRILETLCDTGLAIRDDATDRYRLTLKVRSLADGFDDENWVSALAKPLLGKVAKEVAWPLAIGTLHGTSMLSREASVKEAPATLEWDSAGARLPLLTSSAGRVFMAMCGEDQRATLLDILSRSDRPEDQAARDRSLMNRVIAEVRTNGWAIYDEPVFTELSLAVPILARGRFLASLAMRFTRAAMPLEQAVEKYVPLLKRAATEIGEAFENVPNAPVAS
jgi:IclR family mhp operon transcriptional activator